MAAGTTPKVIDYTSLDYDSVLSDLTRFAQAECGINLTDLNPTDFGLVLVRMMAYCSDLLAYNMHNLVGEAIAVRSIRMSNFKNDVRPLGFVPKGQSAAYTTLTVTFDLGAGPPVVGNLSKHDKFDTDDGVVFQPTADVAVGPGVGVVTVTVDATQGDEVGSETLAISPGTPMQRYALSQPNVLLGVAGVGDTLAVIVGGAQWTRAQYDVLALSEASDKVYALRTDDDGVTYVLFGDGVNGLIPPPAAQIKVNYKVGGGYVGNVEVGAVRNLRSVADPTIIAVTNPTVGDGGGPAQSLSNAQASLPGFVRANDRAVVEDDYGAVAVTVAGVAKATSQTATYGRVVVVTAAPDGGSTGALTDTLRAAISLAIKSRKMAGRRVLVQAPVYAQLRIRVDVTVRSDSSATDIRVLVSTVVADMYDFTSLNFGLTLPLQGLYDQLVPGSVRGLSRAVVREHTVLPYGATYLNFPPTGTGRPQHVAATILANRREWWIQVTAGATPTTRGLFTVTERYIGTVKAVSDVTMGDDAITFPDSNGLVPPAGNHWYLRLNPYELTSTPKQVIGNTQTAVTVLSGDLRTLGQAGDEYAVERLQVAVGVIYSDTIVGATLVGAASLAMLGTWVPGDKLYIYDPLGAVFRATVTGGVPGAYTVDQPIPALAAGAVVDCMWLSDDGTVEFSLVRGVLNYVTGDQMYVDSFGYVDDIQLRRTSYPELVEGNLTVRTIGGRS